MVNLTLLCCNGKKPVVKWGKYLYTRKRENDYEIYETGVYYFWNNGGW